MRCYPIELKAERETVHSLLAGWVQMAVLATFILICIAAVLFLLRFLFALNSDIQTARKHPAVRIERIQRKARARSSVSAITLVYSRSRPVLHPR
jgi:hypothetical protein